MGIADYRSMTDPMLCVSCHEARWYKDALGRCVQCVRGDS